MIDKQNRPGDDTYPADNPVRRPPPRAERGQVMWSWLAILAMGIVLGVTFYTIDARQDRPASPRAIATTSPSTDAQAVPDPAGASGAETTGQGRPD